MDAMVAISMATMSIFINGESVLEIAIQTRWHNSQLSQLPIACQFRVYGTVVDFNPTQVKLGEVHQFKK